MRRAGEECGGEGAPRHDRRAVRSWILYDFANSIYPAVITTAVFPIYYEGAIVGGADGARGLGGGGRRGGGWWGGDGRWPRRRSS